jgi:hypothetical protein
MTWNIKINKFNNSCNQLKVVKAKEVRMMHTSKAKKHIKSIKVGTALKTHRRTQKGQEYKKEKLNKAV